MNHLTATTIERENKKAFKAFDKEYRETLEKRVAELEHEKT